MQFYLQIKHEGPVVNIYVNGVKEFTIRSGNDHVGWECCQGSGRQRYMGRWASLHEAIGFLTRKATSEWASSMEYAAKHGIPAIGQMGKNATVKTS